MRKLVDWYNHDLPCVFVDCLYCDFHCQHMTRQAEIMFKRMKTTKYTKMKHWGLNGAVKICVLELNLHRRLIVNGRSLSSRKKLKAGVIQHSAMEQSAIQNQNVKCHVKVIQHTLSCTQTLQIPLHLTANQVTTSWSQETL